MWVGWAAAKGVATRRNADEELISIKAGGLTGMITAG